MASKWGESSYQRNRNDWYQNGHDSFLVEAAKYGLGRRDLAANVNWFSKVVVADDGAMALDASAAKAGASVELRFEMDTLVLFHTCPHPLNTSPALSAQTRALRDSRRSARDRRRRQPPVGAGEHPRLREQPHLPHRLLRGRVTMITESPLDPAAAHYRKVVPAGEYWIHVVRKGETLRILDLEGNQAADTLFYNADDPAERYSACDTIREQGNIYLSTGTVLRSDLCRPMLTITADTVGRHDTLGGACSAESNTVRYALDKKSMHACRDSFLLAVAENDHYGLTKRDIGHNINFFMNVPVTPDGGLQFADGLSAPGKYVEMVAEMNVIALISNCPQLNNPCNAYNPTPIEVLIWAAGP